MNLYLSPKACWEVRLGGGGHWLVSEGLVLFSPPLPVVLSIFWILYGEQSYSICLCVMAVSFAEDLRAMEPVNCGLRSLKPKTQISFSPF